MSESVRVLFVCLGNICRSPSAEGVFRKLVTEQGMTDRVSIDSCGTADWHTGKSADSRSIEAAGRRGIDLSDLKARQIQSDDLDTFDYVLVMDRSNLADVRDIWRQNGGTEPKLFLEFGRSDEVEVPDPYYGGGQGFEYVLDLIQSASEGLLEDIRGRLA
ncbi:Low molecular weight protein-tyrosine-phosphatase YfkJ [Marinobacter sp. JH2]|uniref:low molecular weight protein-tyrosine-phosphatase n=1 Tax=Marinobacter sp. AL4B TaxID=2871173 RepID=UPI0010568643|nr:MULTISPECIES: low molecular weight protein-tyrosine-phosphatase [unclassified Marinobacter]MBZ0333754.1 low molecular weight phosphotyrosine protein phosphatase [Marinobacter sp. AL4B]QBM17317.1 Low molecular weight protein-tyrosine-phosphatase YfkJ [Marinobacter sp. JH2]